MPLDDDSTVASTVEDPWSAAFVKARAIEEDGAKLFNDIDEDAGNVTLVTTNIHNIRDDDSDEVAEQFNNDSKLSPERVTIVITDDNAKKRVLEGEVHDEVDREGGFRQPKRLAYFFKRRCTDPLL